MSVQVEDINSWYIESGIGHVISHIKDPGAYSACGSLFWGVWGGDLTKDTPKRICAKCRKKLKSATLASKERKEE